MVFSTLFTLDYFNTSIHLLEFAVLILSIVQAFHSSYLPVLSYLRDVLIVLTPVSEHSFCIRVGRFIEDV